MKKVIETPKAPAPIGPYSQAVEVNGMVFTSGQIAINPATGDYDPLEVEAEAKMVMQNLQAVLEAAGASFEHVVKTSIFLKDMKDFSKVNDVYSTYFSSKFPARETVQVSVLPKEAKVEISMIAVKT